MARASSTLALDTPLPESQPTIMLTASTAATYDQRRYRRNCVYPSAASSIRMMCLSDGSLASIWIVGIFIAIVLIGSVRFQQHLGNLIYYLIFGKLDGCQ